ncbi:sugar transferase [Flavobacterium agricola]|uniref:Sugar transferase n=1 Tax=Flavobacterium agricola TaxID=2870839 RepID=A0ABY6M024_9FLAO|nr:sugar transferase [Flavobacterium agricola]UYW00523.1 sugar transferase [Flavobacterium agricola]
MSKRIFDLIFSLVFLGLIWPFLCLAWLFAAIDTQSNGIFTQTRIGQYGKPFKIYKLRTIKWIDGQAQISEIGKLLRKYKFDELPQFINILKGDMSVVGPRPDIPGYYDKLTGNDKKVLLLKPGLTSEAAIKYKNEEMLLQQQTNPLVYNDTVLFPDKVQLNLNYLQKQSFKVDMQIILATLKSYIKQ